MGTSFVHKTVITATKCARNAPLKRNGFLFFLWFFLLYAFLLKKPKKKINVSKEDDFFRIYIGYRQYFHLLIIWNLFTAVFVNDRKNCSLITVMNIEHWFQFTQLTFQRLWLMIHFDALWNCIEHDWTLRTTEICDGIASLLKCYTIKMYLLHVLLLFQ